LMKNFGNKIVLSCKKIQKKFNLCTCSNIKKFYNKKLKSKFKNKTHFFI